MRNAYLLRKKRKIIDLLFLFFEIFYYLQQNSKKTDVRLCKLRRSYPVNLFTLKLPDELSRL